MGFEEQSIAMVTHESRFWKGCKCDHVVTEDRALYLITTLPEEEKQEQIQHEDGDNPLQWLQEVRKLKLSQQSNELLEARMRFKSF